MTNTDYGTYDENDNTEPTDAEVEAFLNGPNYTQVMGIVKMGLAVTTDENGITQIRSEDFISIVESAARAAQTDLLLNIKEMIK